MGKRTMEIRADYDEFGQMVATMYAAGALLTDEQASAFVQDDPIISAIGLLVTPEVIPGGSFKMTPTPAFRAKFLELAKLVAGRMDLVQ